MLNADPLSFNRGNLPACIRLLQHGVNGAHKESKLVYSKDVTMRLGNVPHSLLALDHSSTQ